jgi:hypothetical protein
MQLDEYLNCCIGRKRRERGKRSRRKKKTFLFFSLSLPMCVFSFVVNGGQEDNNVDEKKEVARSICCRTQVCLCVCSNGKGKE